MEEYISKEKVKGFVRSGITDSEYKKIIGRFSEKVLAKNLKSLRGKVE